MTYIPYIWNLKKKKNDTNELTKQKEMHRLTVAGEKDKGGMAVDIVFPEWGLFFFLLDLAC